VIETGRADRPAVERSPVEPATAPVGDAVGVWAPLALAVYVALAATYFVVRPEGRWAEVDSVGQAQAIRAIAARGALMPPLGAIHLDGYGYAAASGAVDGVTMAGPDAFYPNGYAYPAVSTVLLNMTGLSVVRLLQVVYPLVSAVLALSAWALYRELSGSHRVALIAALLLFLNSEFLFVVLRGSHERMLRALMLLSLWLLVRSFRFRDRPGHFAAHVVLFYLSSFALIATNALFGISFVVAIATAMVAAWALGRVRPGLLSLASPVAGRLALVAIAVTAVGYIFVAHLYPPAGHSLQVLHDVLEQLVALFLTTETGADPYTRVVGGWTSMRAYFLLSMETYLLMGASAIVWAWQGARWLRGAQHPPTLLAWLLWLLYGAFAFQGVLAILSDRSGLLGGNVQHRSFPSFAMVAAPLLAVALGQWRPARWQRAVAAGGVALLAGLALLKTTNEPSLSNKWTFYTPAELRALEWADQHHRDAAIWVGLDERLVAAFELTVGDSTHNNKWNIYAPQEATRSFLISDVVRLQSARLHQPLPAVAEANRVYDNGTVPMYRSRAQTHQR
jgi:hypothetical protein